MNALQTNAGTVLFVALALAAVAADADAADAKVLDAKAAASLVNNRMWQQKLQRGPGYNYWAWKGDGSVCLRLGDKSGKCADTGQWKQEGERLCYELTWWGAEAGLKSNCIRIADQGKGSYGALQDNGFTLYEFSLVKQ